MKQLAIVFGLLFFSFGFAQTTTLLKGKVMCDTLAVSGIEVINLTSEQSTKTDSRGFFVISARNKDVLAFYSKEYVFKKVVVVPEFFQQEQWRVNLIRSAVELDEVVIKNTKLKVPKFTYEQAAAARIDKQAANPKNPFVYDGTITNGMDFMEIGRKIISFFKNSDNPKRKKQPEEDFIAYAKASIDESFYKQKLGLQKNEIDNFLSYCKEDPESKKVFINKDELTLLDFLLKKQKAYLELIRENNK
ncbi:hypothetical protein [Flavobacterium sp.]|uniref:hypothetical protein n=1 Tax=Flavobacterium sp. TaxID=239 RepID=UPI0022BEA105|nr:hypothetical protein [Flavobacterium sp.]MCZ8228325.1 hypothetical protein [Flavobacterium sp.]